MGKNIRLSETKLHHCVEADISFSTNLVGCSDFSTMSTSFSRLSSAELDDIRSVFEMFDIQGQGKVRVHAIEETLQNLSSLSHPRGRNNAKLESLLSNLRQLPQSSSVTYDELVQLILRPDPRDNKSDIEKTFEMFDSSGKGYIDADDLRKVATQLGEILEDDEISDMLDRGSSEGQVSLGDFERIVTSRLNSEISRP